MNEQIQIPAVIEGMPDGIYFDMAEEEYHAIPRLSASGIQNMMISPATFWAKSWLNPDQDDAEETAAQEIGKAYHCARLEPERFFSCYVPEIDKGDLDDDCLMTDAALKAALKDMGQPQTKGDEAVLDRARRLRDLGYTGQIWHLELEAWEIDKGDRIGLPRKVWDEIRRDMHAIRRNPEVLEHLVDGAAEVVILWTDPITDMPMKARLDYLRPLSFTDFKTFDNSQGRHLEQAILGAFRFNRYYIQGAVYWQAYEAIRAGLLEVRRHFTEAQIELIEAIKANPQPGRCFYVFQEKKGIPNILVREYGIRTAHASLRAAAPTDDAFAQAAAAYGNFSQLYRKAEAEINWAQRTFRNMQEIYPNGEPWFPINATGRIDDESFPPSFLEGEW